MLIAACKSDAVSKLGLQACGWDQSTPLPADVSRMHRRAYFASLSYTDALVGSIVAGLTSSGLAATTVVALWSDHGWALGENNEWVR